jgi:parallel beta-helix repeat protein
MSLTKVSYSMITGAAANVLDYGADVTGVADSTSAINAAIDALGANGGTVYFPPGTYRFTSKITVDTPVRLVGSGRSSNISAGKYNTRLLKDGDFTGIEFVAGSAFGGVFDLILDSAGGSDASDGLYIDSGRIDVQRVCIWNQGRMGMWVHDANASAFMNVELLNNGLHGLYVSGASPSPDVNGMSFYNIDARSNTGSGVCLDVSFSNSFYGCTIQYNGSYGIQVEDSDRNSFYGVYSESNTAGGLWFSNQANYNELYFGFQDDVGTPNNPTGTNYWSFAGGDHSMAKLAVGNVQTPATLVQFDDSGGAVQTLSRTGVATSNNLLGRFSYKDANTVVALISAFTGSSATAGEIEVAVKTSAGALAKSFTFKEYGSVNFTPLAADPAAASAGDVYYNSGTNKLRCYNGSTWNDLF